MKKEPLISELTDNQLVSAYSLLCGLASDPEREKLYHACQAELHALEAEMDRRVAQYYRAPIETARLRLECWSIRDTPAGQTVLAGNVFHHPYFRDGQYIVTDQLLAIVRTDHRLEAVTETERYLLLATDEQWLERLRQKGIRTEDLIS